MRALKDRPCLFGEFPNLRDAFFWTSGHIAAVISLGKRPIYTHVLSVQRRHSASVAGMSAYGFSNPLIPLGLVADLHNPGRPNPPRLFEPNAWHIHRNGNQLAYRPDFVMREFIPQHQEICAGVASRQRIRHS